MTRGDDARLGGSVTARDLFVLVRDLRAAGIPYDLDLSWTLLVRHHIALTVALGRLCIRIDEARTYEHFALACGLRKRCHVALRWIEALGKRSRWAGLAPPPPRRPCLVARELRPCEVAAAREAEVQRRARLTEEQSEQEGKKSAERRRGLGRQAPALFAMAMLGMVASLDVPPPRRGR